MKTIAITGTAILSALLGTAAFAFAVQDHPHEKQDGSQQQNTHEQARPQQQHGEHQAQQSRQEEGRSQQQHAQQQHDQQQNAHQQRAQQQYEHQQNDQRQRDQQQYERQQGHRQQTDRAEQRRYEQDRGNGNMHGRPEQRGQEQRVWQQHRASNWQSDHRNWQQRGGYRGYRIPDYRFRGYFGRNHWFRIGGLPIMEEGGYPRFQYNGYWFSVLDPWPANWGDNWYDQDDVYVDYVDNGYYLFNRREPGIGIAISISM